MSKTEKSWLVSEYTREIRGLSNNLRHAQGLARKIVLRQLHTAKAELSAIQKHDMQIFNYLHLA
jgi:hypothetical protein